MITITLRIEEKDGVATCYCDDVTTKNETPWEIRVCNLMNDAIIREMSKIRASMALGENKQKLN